MNIAERIIEGYSSKDFKSNYSFALYEGFTEYRWELIDRILDYFNVSNYETQKALNNWQVIDRKQAVKILNFINDNWESYIDRMCNYWVGHTSIDSIEFGEQEECITDFINHKTGKPYGRDYIIKVFEDAGYCINDKKGLSVYAYYNLGGEGLHINLLANTEAIKMLDEFLLTIK